MQPSITIPGWSYTRYNRYNPHQVRDQAGHGILRATARPHLVLVEGSSRLVLPQLGGEPEGAVLGDVGSGGVVAGVDDLLLSLSNRPTVDQHALAPRHFHDEGVRGRGLENSVNYCIKL